MKFKKTTTIETPKPVTRSLGAGYCKLPRHKWIEGRNSLRFLPQYADSPFPNFLQFSEYSVADKAGNKRSLALDESGDRALQNAFFYLWRLESDNSKTIPDYKSRLKSKANPEGWDLNPRPRVAGLALNTLNETVEVVILPGTREAREGAPKPRVGTGSKLLALSEEKDIKGKLKYGDITDPETGGLVSVTVVNAGTLNVDYSVSYEGEYPVTEAILSLIKPWDELVQLSGAEEVRTALKEYLPANVFEGLNCPTIFGFLDNE